MPDLPDVAERLLQLIVATAKQAEISLPERQYVAPGIGGAEAWDGAQLTVALLSLDPTSAAVQSTGAGGGSRGWFGPPSATLRAEIVRDTPTVTDDGLYLAAEVYHASGMAAMADAALLSTVRGLVPATFGDDGRTVRLGQVLPAGPEGGLAGTVLVVTLDLL